MCVRVCACAYPQLGGQKTVLFIEKGKAGEGGDCLVGVLYRNSEVLIWTFRFEMPIRHSCRDLKRAAEFSNLKLKVGVKVVDLGFLWSSVQRGNKYI